MDVENWLITGFLFFMSTTLIPALERAGKTPPVNLNILSLFFASQYQTHILENTH